MNVAIYDFAMAKTPKMGGLLAHLPESWALRGEWHHGIETPEDTIRRLQQFVTAITHIAPIFGEFVVSASNLRFSESSTRRLVNALKKNPLQEAYYRGDDAVSYHTTLAVLPVKGVQSYVYIDAFVCRGTMDNELFLHFGEINRKMFQHLTVKDWVAILEHFVLSFELKTASLNADKFWYAKLERRIGWASYVSRATVTELPQGEFPAVIPLGDLGAIYLCSRTFNGRTTESMLATATKFQAALAKVQRK